jgi:hypothetical protein
MLRFVGATGVDREGETTVDWRKSSFSGAQGASCVETASADGLVMVRDTTNRDGGTLSFGAAAWREFTATLR